MDKIKRILKFGMRMEKDAGDFYRFYMDKAETHEVKKFFGELAIIEDKHFRLLKEKYNALGGDAAPLTISWVVDNTSAAKDPHILANNADLTTISTTETPDLTIVRMAFLIENDFFEFYSHASDSIEDMDVKKFLRSLSEWEKQHRDFFHAEYRKLIKKNWDDMEELLFPE